MCVAEIRSPGNIVIEPSPQSIRQLVISPRAVSLEGSYRAYVSPSSIVSGLVTVSDR